MATVIVRRSPTIDTDVSELPVSPLLQRIYAQRQVTTARELDKNLHCLPPPSALCGIEQAVALLATALRHQQRILIVADFDADGATSCALALRSLHAFGARDVSFVVPNRFEYGYGLTPEIVAVAAAKKPDLLITVDNGISSLAGVTAAQAQGMQVLITDHHLPGNELPTADAIVNPNQPGDEFPCKNLAGVGVIFYVMLALRSHLRRSGWFSEQGLTEPNMAQWLDLVAFGTVADVVPLDHTNRILVEQGLRRIRSGQCSAGISALIDITKRNQQRLVASDIGFVLGPRLNAAGRLEDMSYGIQCLLCDDAKQARVMAWELDRLNRQRQSIEGEMQQQAKADLQRLQLSDSELPFGLCLYDENWHQGVIGILAARIREHTHRPVIAFAPENEDTIKGSARSVAGLHIRDALDSVAARNPGLVEKFGGHAMAAGMSLARANFDAFAKAFDEEVRQHLSPEDLRGVILSDGELSGDQLILEVAEELRHAEPWGQAFPEPVFDGLFELVSHRVVGSKHLKLVVKPTQNLSQKSQVIDAIAFNQAADFADKLTSQLRLAYRLDVNEWQGRRSPQLIVEYLEAL